MRERQREMSECKYACDRERHWEKKTVCVCVCVCVCLYLEMEKERERERERERGRYFEREAKT